MGAAASLEAESALRVPQPEAHWPEDSTNTTASSLLPEAGGDETIPYAMSLLRHGVKGRRLAAGDLEFLELKSAIQILSL
jgi:hypothetical protein